MAPDGAYWCYEHYMGRRDSKSGPHISIAAASTQAISPNPQKTLLFRLALDLLDNEKIILIPVSSLQLPISLSLTLYH